MLETLMWGERGLVATFFLDLSTEVARWNRFLDKVLRLPGEVETAWAVVEPDFGKHFGKPDAAAHLKLSGSTTKEAVVLLEAKRGTYERSSWPHDRRHELGFNSTINGQVELNYRLALGLSAFMPEVHTRLIEPSWVTEIAAYAQTYPGGRRSLKKAAVLKQVVARLANQPATQYFHVVVTSDDTCPFARNSLRNRWPLIRGVRGVDEVDEWDGFQKNQLRWVKWDCMNELAKTWESGEGQFLRSYELNQPNLGVTPTRRPDGGGVTSDGVEMVQLKVENYPLPQRTVLHFSWKGERCALRNYADSPDELPVPDRRFTTSMVEGWIIARHPQGVRRRYTDVPWWHEKTRELNQRLSGE
jgi:hypothetical protein